MSVEYFCVNAAGSFWLAPLGGALQWEGVGLIAGGSRGRVAVPVVPPNISAAGFEVSHSFSP